MCVLVFSLVPFFLLVSLKFPLVQRVSMLFQGNLKFNGSFKDVSRKFKWCFNVVSRVFQGSFGEILRVFQESFK